MLRGYVFSIDNEPLIGANIRVFDMQLGTQTNEKGQFELRLEEGLHRISFSFLGLETQTLEFVVEKDLVQNIFLNPDSKTLNEVVVRVKKRDYSYEVIQKVIENKDKVLNQYENYACKTYIKATEEPSLKKPPKNEEDEDPYKSDSLPTLNFFEATINRFESKPDRLKEERTAVKKIGNQDGLFFTSITHGEFDLYQNLQKIERLSENSFISPISQLGYVSYRYELMETYYEGTQAIYRIKVKPKELGNALYEGEIEVYSGIWVLKKATLSLSPKALIIYDKFNFSQQYEKVQDKWVIKNETFNWQVKERNNIYKGTTIVEQSEFIFDSTYGKRFFGPEIAKTTAEAYKKDSTFWDSIRPIPLSSDERENIRKKELLDLKLNSKEYLDSIDAEYNKITFLKIVWSGIGKINRSKKSELYFNSLPTLINPLALGGFRLNYGMFYRKLYENRKEFFIRPYLNYGFRNNDLLGSLEVQYLYNPIKRSRISASFGKGFDVINGAATISDIARRSNFYISTGFYVNHKTELFNGFYLNTGVSLYQRRDFSDFQFTSGGDNLFNGNNEPTFFPTNNKFATNVGIEYTPRQQYISEPNEKIVLGSSFPTFRLDLNKAWGAEGTRNSNFTQLEMSVYQYFNVGILGTSEYKVSAGKFLDTTLLAPMDYRYQRGGDPLWFSPSMSTFQLIPQTFATLDWFFESHYEHQFNGFLTSKIPLLNKTGIRAVAGAGLLYVPESKYQYSELYFGINRVFKLGRNRFRIGVYNVTAQSNSFGVRNGFKFSFEPYNRDKNTWSF